MVRSDCGIRRPVPAPHTREIHLRRNCEWGRESHDHPHECHDRSSFSAASAAGEGTPRRALYLQRLFLDQESAGCGILYPRCSKPSELSPTRAACRSSTCCFVSRFRWDCRRTAWDEAAAGIQASSSAERCRVVEVRAGSPAPHLRPSRAAHSARSIIGWRGIGAF